MQDPVDGLRRVDPGYKKAAGKIRFSKTELVHITIAIIVLAIAFAILLRDSSLHSDPTINMIYIFGISVILVICSFMLHELGHKFVAQRFHAWSEFRVYPFGLVIAVVSAFIGFLFAAPGAVYIRGDLNKEINGKISLAGPGVNFIIAAIAIAVCMFLEQGTLAYVTIQMLAYLNAFLGLFNMIPIMPFDGSKIVAWNIPVYLTAVVIGVAELAFVYLYLLA